MLSNIQNHKSEVIISLIMIMVMIL